MKRKILALMLTWMMAAGMLAGCAGQEKAETENEDTAEASEENEETEGWTIGVATPNNAVPFFARLNAGMEDTAGKYNITLKIQDANDDTNTQVNQVETFIQQGVDMIMLMPTQLDSLVPSAKQINQADIPFMTVNRMLTAGSAEDVGVDMITYVGADDYSGGQKQGELLAQMLGDSGKVVLIQGTLGSSMCTQRQAGLEDYLAENAPGIEIIDMQASNQDQTQSITVMQNFLTKYSEGQIDAVVAQDPYSAIGACDAIEDAGRTELYEKVIGFDYPEEVKEYITKGLMYGSVIQAPYDQGVLAIETAYQYLTEGGDGIEENTFTDLPIVSKENVDEYEPAW